MLSIRKMQLLALALCLCHASAFTGVITAFGSANVQQQGMGMGMQQGDQRLVNVAMRRGRDVVDKLGEQCSLVGDRLRTRHVLL